MALVVILHFPLAWLKGFIRAQVHKTRVPAGVPCLRLASMGSWSWGGAWGLSVCLPVGEALSTVVTPKQLGDTPDWSHLQNFEQIKTPLKRMN